MAPAGFKIFPGHFDVKAQAALTEAVFAAERSAPFYRPLTPGGRPMSVRMTNFGPLGWVTDASGYRYQPLHPDTGRPWPNIPGVLIDLWRDLACSAVDPDCCLVNLYDAQARMGLHQDKDEADFSFPVLSVSLAKAPMIGMHGSDRSFERSPIRCSMFRALRC